MISFVFNNRGRWQVGCTVAAWWLMAHFATAATPTVLYQTSFEAEQGYSAGEALEGQDEWVGWGEDQYVGENGITTGVFSDFGQQAYIGGSLDAIGTNYYYVLRPLGFESVPAEYSSLHFSGTDEHF